MKFRPYTKYKPSGVKWLSDVPEHWEVAPLKRIVIIPVTDGPHETPEIFDEGIPFISAEAIRNNKIDFERKRGFISEAEHRRFSFKYHPKRNDIYMIKSGATTGNLAIVETDEEFNIWSPLAVIRVCEVVAYARFVLSSMNSKEFQTSVQLFWSYGTQQNIGMNVIENLKIPLPPFSEQKKISDFLDSEIGRIDDLIAKNENLIELLKEKRTALISRAVTKGLDPDVRLKPSGVDWLGDVPEHWECWKIAHGFDSIGSGTTPTSDQLEWYDGKIPWVTTGELRENVIFDTEKKVTIEAIINFSALKRFPVGSLVIAMYGATIGRLGILGVDATTNQACCVLYGGGIFDVKFVFYWLLAFKATIILLASGGGQPNISQDKIKSLKIFCPKVSEQQAIVEYLDRETNRIDELISKVTQALDKLKEYRTAIISASVTGKIDVREGV
jgi:type I restriction enzyme S subunit